jgi:SAM-dependent methyltransferase
MGNVGEDTIVQRLECRSCGFIFSDSSFAGGEQFYKELQHTNYYSPYRQEFPRTVDFAKRKGLKRVLDVGCGTGIFLDMAKAEGLETYGLELNSNAAAEARSKGHVVYDKLLHELDASDVGGSMDLVTIFQVLEHVADPVKLLRDAEALLRSGGFIAIAVPSAEGLLRLADLEPAMWPPHHVSWWRRADFKTLSQMLNMRLVTSGCDTLLGGELKTRWLLHNRLAALHGRRPLPGGSWLPSALSYLYRKAGLKHLFPGAGPSTYCFLQRP